jgi:hypothetical protein
MPMMMIIIIIIIIVIMMRMMMVIIITLNVHLSYNGECTTGQEILNVRTAKSIHEESQDRSYLMLAQDGQFSRACKGFDLQQDRANSMLEEMRKKHPRAASKVDLSSCKPVIPALVAEVDQELDRKTVDSFSRVIAPAHPGFGPSSCVTLADTAAGKVY